jgi:hypothetical protein
MLNLIVKNIKELNIYLLKNICMAHKFINIVENIPQTILHNVPFISPVIKSAISENIQSIKETIDE